MRIKKFVFSFFFITCIISACQKEEIVENTLPIVNAGRDTTIDLTNATSDSIKLIGSATDADGTIAGYLWSQVSGPNQSSIITPGSATTYINGLISGKYVFQLMATDNKGAVGVKSIEVTIIQKTIYPNNLPPVVNPGNDTTVTLASSTADSVRLIGSAGDLDGIVVGYLWSQVSGPNTALIKTPGSPSTAISGIVAGTYVFQLMAIDNKGATGIKSITVTVVMPPPVTLNLKPNQNPTEGYIHSMTPGEAANMTTPELNVSAWTNGGIPQDLRSLLKFDLSNLPAGAKITSAKLSLYSSPNPYSGNQIDANFGNNNTLLIQRITSNWNSSVTWNTQPSIDISSQIIIPHTNQSKLDLIDVDVTTLVKDMVQKGNYGFLLRLQNEVIYTSRLFASSKHPNSAKHPKLVLQYTN
jgi:hypothetical protein